MGENTKPKWGVVGHWEALGWAAESLGLEATGVGVKPEDAPSGAAWGLFCFGKNETKAFWQMYISVGRRVDADRFEGGKKRGGEDEIAEMMAKLRGKSEGRARVAASEK